MLLVQLTFTTKKKKEEKQTGLSVARNPKRADTQAIVIWLYHHDGACVWVCVCRG